MEAVRAFNNELSGLYETKPPVSRAKMANVTKGAIKAIKFYKHVVQSVEKFIQKCKPEYKVPGLYVIDSVVRQSRHQFGPQKDVFAPRFTKNIITTFQNLFKCPGEERSKIVRVLNLWQKNDVFPSEIVQPLLDLAADPTKPSLIAAAQAAVDRVLAASGKSSSSSQQQQQHHHHQQSHQAPPPAGDTGEDSMNQAAAESMLATQNDMLNTVTQLLQQTNSGNTSLSAQQQSLQQLQLLQQQLIQQTALMQQPTGGAPLIDANLLAQIQALTNQLLQKTEAKPDDGGGFNKKLLDFDYGESDEEEDRRPIQQNLTGDVQTILNDSGLMQQIHQVSQTIQKNNEYTSELTEQEKRRRILEQQQAEFDHRIAQPPAPDAEYGEEGEYMEEVQDEDFRDHQQFRDRDDRDRRDRRRKSRDRSRSRTPKRRRRSRSRDRRRRSRSRDRHRRSRSKDRERKEKERDRKKKGLPLVRANFVTICTTTIWIGHLNKFTSEDELKTELERYGPVENINMVPPRGCAYVVMSNRKDAYKAIDRLKGYKLNGSALKTAWAQSTGIRESEFKDSWDLDEGAMYLPWDNLPKDLTHFLDGAIIDGASLPDHLKDIPTEKVKVEQSEQPETTTAGQVSNPAGMVNVPGQQQIPQMPGQPPMMGMMPGNMPPMPGMMPGMMMPMQRPPVVPGMPPQPMTMTPGAPPQMIPGSQVPAMPGVRPPNAGVIPQMPAMSIPSTAAANSLAQTIQNIMSTTAGVIPSSPSVPPRPSGLLPGMSPGAPRFGFNPNMPPPGFRLPPPGFGSPMRPLIGGPPTSMPPVTKPTESSQLGERLSMLAGQGTKQPEMAWPPDSNDKDDDMEEDEDINEDRSEIIQNNTSVPPGGQFGRPANMPPRGMDQSPMRMMGPPPPGGFPPGGPPGPTNQPWNMPQRMGGPRGMRPPRGGPNMGPMGNQDRFGGPMNQRMGGPGPRGPPFMGNMPGGPGFQRFGGPRGPGNIRGPVSLLDLDIKPKDTFVGESFKSEEGPIPEEEMVEEENTNIPEENYNENEQNEPEEDPRNCYPFNTWTSVNRNNADDRNRDRSDGFERSNRGRDRDRDRDNDDRSHDRHDSRDRDRYRSRDHGRSRERERDQGHDRDRGDRDRDWKRRDDRRDDRRDRERDRGERDRSRRSRWSDNDTEKQNIEEKSDDRNLAQEDNKLTEAVTNVENSGNISKNVPPVENITEEKDNDENSDVTHETAGDKNSREISQGLNENVNELDNNTNSNKENIDQNENVEQNSSVEKIEDIKQVENVNESSQNNGPPSEEKLETVSENKVEVDKKSGESSENVKQNVDMDLEEGELSS